MKMAVLLFAMAFAEYVEWLSQIQRMFTINPIALDVRVCIYACIVVFAVLLRHTII